jgi:hypothetical protein
MGTLIAEKKVEKNWLAQRIQSHLTDKIIEPFEIRLPNEGNYRFGDGDRGLLLLLMIIMVYWHLRDLISCDFPKHTSMAV